MYPAPLCFAPDAEEDRDYAKELAEACYACRGQPTGRRVPKPAAGGSGLEQKEPQGPFEAQSFLPLPPPAGWQDPNDFPCCAECPTDLLIRFSPASKFDRDRQHEEVSGVCRGLRMGGEEHSGTAQRSCDERAVVQSAQIGVGVGAMPLTGKGETQLRPQNHLEERRAREPHEGRTSDFSGSPASGYRVSDMICIWLV